MVQDMDDLSLADVESAKPSAAFMANVIIDKKGRQRRSATAAGGHGRRRDDDGRRGARRLAARVRARPACRAVGA